MDETKRKPVLTIAGSDSSGGAGIQADIKTMLANGVYAMSAVTALTAQNTLGVDGIMDATPEILEKQLVCIFSDIFPEAVKIGMVSDKVLIHVIADHLKKYKAKNIVVDPVMVSTSGARLLKEDAVRALREELLPLALLITPNIPEAEILSGERIRGREEMERIAKLLGERYRTAVLLKGGHSVQDASDVLFYEENLLWYEGERVLNDNTHGTGCTLSSAIASYLARGCDVREAVKEAKEYLTGALKAGLDLGNGSGPLDHGYRIFDERTADGEV